MMPLSEVLGASVADRNRLRPGSMRRIIILQSLLTVRKAWSKWRRLMLCLPLAAASRSPSAPATESAITGRRPKPCAEYSAVSRDPSQWAGAIQSGLHSTDAAEDPDPFLSSAFVPLLGSHVKPTSWPEESRNVAAKLKDIPIGIEYIVSS